ncbi:hypothetical protein RUND412_011509 [Rhizina undulata]
MNNGDDQRWRQQRTSQQSAAPGSNQHQQQRVQGGQRRNISREGNAFSGQGYNRNNNNNGNGNAWGGDNRALQQSSQHQMSQQQANSSFVEGHMPVRGFNSKEVEDYLFRGYEKEVLAAGAQGGDEGSKPLVYKSDKGWSTPTQKSGAWGPRGIDFSAANMMASGGTFLNQLRKSHIALQTGGKE